jgi:hypothetical protein
LSALVPGHRQTLSRVQLPRSSHCDEDRVDLLLEFLDVIVKAVEAVFQNVWLGRRRGLLLDRLHHVLAEAVEFPADPAERTEKGSIQRGQRGRVPGKFTCNAAVRA